MAHSMPERRLCDRRPGSQDKPAALGLKPELYSLSDWYEYRSGSAIE